MVFVNPPLTTLITKAPKMTTATKSAKDSIDGWEPERFKASLTGTTVTVGPKQSFDNATRFILSSSISTTTPTKYVFKTRKLCDGLEL